MSIAFVSLALGFGKRFGLAAGAPRRAGEGARSCCELSAVMRA